MRYLIIGVVSLLIVACGPDSGPSGTAAGPSCAGTVNLLKNPEFRSSTDRLLVDWNSTQHGNTPSFLVSVDQGVVTVDRNGPEPWYNLEQPVDLKKYAGHRMRYQAELKLTLDSKGWAHAFEPRGGLLVLIWALQEPAIIGTRLSVSSSAEHEPNLGETDWFPAATEFTVPANPRRSIIGLIHQANGSISIKNPALFDCGPAPQPGPEPEPGPGA